MNDQTLGDRVRQRREELGYDQYKLAKMVGYKSQSGISQLERNLHRGSTKLVELAAALKTTVHWLQYGDVESMVVRSPSSGYRIDLPAADQRLLAAFRMLTASQKTAIIDDIETKARANAELIKELGHNKSNGTEG